MKTSINTQAQVTEGDPRWVAVMARDAGADGSFYYAVKTTGVYCRPSCPSRHARPENVTFFATLQQAQAAGFRPCKRCRPDQQAAVQRQVQLVAEACRLISASAQPPSLDQLAAHAGLSRFHFHRMFKRFTGLTHKAFALAHRGHQVSEHLVQSRSVTEAIFDAGYQASSRFYADADQLLGMTPTRYRGGGQDVEIRFAIAQCSLGALLVAASPKGVCAISLADDAQSLLQQLQDRFPRAQLLGGDAQFERMVAQVIGLIEAPRVGVDLPLDIRGTAFQQRVWQALREIPMGSTVSYRDIASRLGMPKAARAVAGACAANPLAVVIPCHRVVRLDGDLSGYRWGVDRKQALLLREQAQ